MQRYFVKEKIKEQFFLYDTDIHHIKNVMRNKIGDQIEIVYGDKVYLCKIDNLDNFSISIIKSYDENRNGTVKLTIAIALVQEQKFDLIIQKLTELGVSKIIPVKMERSIVKLDNFKEEKKIQRWKNICKEASEQSHRTTIPEITNLMSISDLVENKNDLNLVCSLSESTKPIDTYLTNDVKSILLVIGPEGGISKNEEQFLLENNFYSASLGKRVYRVETAAIYVASIINYVYKG